MNDLGVDVTEAESNGHSLFGASKAHRILPCPGSLLAEIGEPDTAGYEAAEGTAAHELAEKMAVIVQRVGVLTARDYESWAGQERLIAMPAGGHLIPITPDMLEYVREYVQWCWEEPGDHYFEQRVDYSRLTPIPDQGGTADHIAVQPGHLTITDFKYGTGVQVFAECNPQAMLYALGALFAWDWLYDIQTVTIRICQPRLQHFDVWQTTREELFAFAEYAKERFALAWDRQAKRYPSEKACQFCAAKVKCPAVVAAADRIADLTFVDEGLTHGDMAASIASLDCGVYPAAPLPRAPELTSADLGRILDLRKVFESFFETAFEELQRRCLTQQEEPPEGWMIAEGKTVRYIEPASMPLAEKLLLDRGMRKKDLYDPAALKSPAQLEALIVGNLKVPKKEAVQLLRPLVTSRSGAPVLARKTPTKRAPADLASESFVDETETVTL